MDGFRPVKDGARVKNDRNQTNRTDDLWVHTNSDGSIILNGHSEIPATILTRKMIKHLRTMDADELESFTQGTQLSFDQLTRALHGSIEENDISAKEQEVSTERPQPGDMHATGRWDGPTERTKTNWYGKAKAGFPWVFSAEFGWSKEITKTAQSRGYSVFKKHALTDYLDELDDWEDELKASGRWSESKELPRMAWLALKSAVLNGFGIIGLVQKVSWPGRRKRR